MKTLGDSMKIDSMKIDSVKIDSMIDSLMIDSLKDSLMIDSLMIDSLKDSLIDSLNYSKVSTDSKNSLKDSLLIDSLMMLNDSFQFASFPLDSPFHSSSLLPASRNRNAQAR